MTILLISSLVIEKGQVLTGYYRLMNKSGGYTWLQTCATVVCSTKNADEQNIICVNYVIRWVVGQAITKVKSTKNLFHHQQP